MIEFTGHRLDAVVVLDRRRGRDRRSGCCSGPQIEGRADDTEDVIRRRQEVYAEQTEPLIEVYRDRGLLRRGRRHGRGRRGHRSASSTRSTSSPRADAPVGLSRTAGSRSRRPSRSTACARPAWWSAAPSSCCAAPCAPGITTGELDAIAEDNIRSAGATPSFLGYHGRSRRRSAPRSTTRSCTASRATGCSPRATSSRIDCGAIVDGWHGDAAITVAGRRGRRRGRPS